MTVPSPLSGSPPCVMPDGSMNSSCDSTSPASLAPYPPSAPPPSNRTLHFKIDSQPSKYEKHITEYFLNQKPWQLYHSQMAPALFIEDPSNVDPPIVGDLPWGTTVDVIVQNTLNETVPLYKHGDPTCLLGSQPNEKWDWRSVEDAVRDGVKLNLKSPAQQLVHEVPPLGWAVLRWQILIRGATMMHAAKFKYYAVRITPCVTGVSGLTNALESWEWRCLYSRAWTTVRMPKCLKAPAIYPMWSLSPRTTACSVDIYIPQGEQGVIAL